MDKIINLDLISHPLNWAIVLSVLLLMSMGFVAVHQRMTAGCACGQSET